jgi:hypothetical protein
MPADFLMKSMTPEVQLPSTTFAGFAVPDTLFFSTSI